VGNRRFHIYRDGSPWKTVPYNAVNQIESYGMVMFVDTFDVIDFFSYTNNLSDRVFKIYRSGKLWKTVAYKGYVQNQSFGQYGGASSANTIFASLYSYVNDVSNRRFIVYKKGSLLKTVAYNGANHAESFGVVTDKENLITYVNDVRNRQFLFFYNGVPFKTSPYSSQDLVESLASIFPW
jgi:hypothetical protein